MYRWSAWGSRCTWSRCLRAAQRIEPAVRSVTTPPTSVRSALARVGTGVHESRAVPRDTRQYGHVAHPRMFDDADPLLARVRVSCARLPQAVEFESHGRPNFRAGSRQVFAVYGAGPDHPYALILRIDPDDEAGLRADPRLFIPPYYPDRLALDLDTADIDWSEVDELLESSYRSVASRRMIRALEGELQA